MPAWSTKLLECALRTWVALDCSERIRSEAKAEHMLQSEHGGHTNACTSSEDTNYHFEVNWEALEDGLDRFAQFFISPLISADGVDREVKAVDSE